MSRVRYSRSDPAHRHTAAAAWDSLITDEWALSTREAVSNIYYSLWSWEQ